jgi:hypothetical protein
VRLGPSLPDAEFDGQPTFSATGDDLLMIDDEDGIDFRSGVMLVRDRNFDYPTRMFTYYMMAQGATVCLKPLATVSGHFSGWIDWNRDTDWEDYGEQIFGAEPVISGPDFSKLCFSVPLNASEGYTYGRFRFSTAPILSPYGLAEDGEVEDYLFLVVHSIDAGDAPDDENSPRYPHCLATPAPSTGLHL